MVNDCVGEFRAPDDNDRKVHVNCDFDFFFYVRIIADYHHDNLARLVPLGASGLTPFGDAIFNLKKINTFQRSAF